MKGIFLYKSFYCILSYKVIFFCLFFFRCKRKFYFFNFDFFDISVVIVFYNEVWFIFFRIVYSIINRLLRELFNEILLVDDVSERGIIEGLVDLYVRIYLYFLLVLWL